MKDALVTLFGGGGFLGRYVAQELLEAGARVRIAQRDTRRAWFLKPLGGLGQTQFVNIDVTKPETVARAAYGADAVVNLVGTFTAFEAVNVRGARAVADAAAAAAGRALVHVSAIGADTASPSRYARSKAEGEAEVRAAFPAATILRPSVVFGREDRFINRIAGMIAALPIVPILKPETRFQPVYVHDVARAIVAALADPGTHGGRTYELGGPEVFSMAELHRWIAAEIGRNRFMPALPDAAGAVLAALPGSPISKDQWLLLQRDNVVADDAAGLAALGIAPTPLAAVAPGWLVQYRRQGRFGRVAPIAATQ